MPTLPTLSGLGIRQVAVLLQLEREPYPQVRQHRAGTGLDLIG